MPIEIKAQFEGVPISANSKYSSFIIWGANDEAFGENYEELVSQVLDAFERVGLIIHLTRKKNPTFINNGEEHTPKGTKFEGNCPDDSTSRLVCSVIKRLDNKTTILWRKQRKQKNG